MESPSEETPVLRVWKALELGKLSPAEILSRYSRPADLRSHVRGLDIPCSYRTAETLMGAAGWVMPPSYYEDPSIPPQARRKKAYRKGEAIQLSKYFGAFVGDIIQRLYKGEVYTAEILISGRLQSLDWNEDPLSPTGWARKVQGRIGNMSVMPQFFWRKVVVKVPWHPRGDTS